jgi:hypothetical protein
VGASERPGLRLLALLSVPAAFALGLVPEAGAAVVWPFAVLIAAALVLGTPVFVAMGAVAVLLFFKDGTPITAVTAEV